MIQLRKLQMDEKYKKEWHEHSTDFIGIFKDDKLVRNTLYRKGGVGGHWKDGYLTLIKYIEAYYPDDITIDPTEKKHLEGRWCIINEDGDEIFETDGMFSNSLYHLGGIIISNNDYILNMINGLRYGSGKTFKSKQYIFLDNTFEKDEHLKGIVKIDKFTGEFEVFK